MADMTDDMTDVNLRPGGDTIGPRTGLLAELVSVPTPTVPLDGLLYRAQAPARGGVLLMHGNMRNFYSGPARFLPGHLVPRGYDCFAFNRRGHDILTTGDDRLPQGGAYQTAAQSMQDNELAAAFLAGEGHAAPIVIGHSNGGLLAATFAARHPQVRALVLLSAHAGGPGHVEHLARTGLLGADQHEQLLATARTLVSEGRGEELLRTPGWWYLLSAASFVDRVDRSPTLLEEAAQVTCPVLFIKGADESDDQYPADRFAERVQGPSDVVQLQGSDHFYSDLTPAVGAIVAEWLDGALSG